MVQAHHAVDVRVFRQQIAFDDFHHVIHHARHAVHAGGNAEQIFGADAAVRIAIAFKGIAFQRGSGSGTRVASGSVFSGGAFGSSTSDSSIQLPCGIARTA
jgi:hypothetical protein